MRRQVSDKSWLLSLLIVFYYTPRHPKEGGSHFEFPLLGFLPFFPYALRFSGEFFLSSSELGLNYSVMGCTKENSSNIFAKMKQNIVTIAEVLK